jgi:hypothetical protein
MNRELKRIIGQATAVAVLVICVLFCMGAREPSQTDFELRRASELRVARVTETNEQLRAELAKTRKDLQATNDFFAASTTNLRNELDRTTRERDAAIQAQHEVEKERNELRRFKSLVLHPRYGFLRDKVAWHSNRDDPHGGHPGTAAYRELYRPYFGNAAALDRIIAKRFDDDWDNTNDANRQGQWDRP